MKTQRKRRPKILTHVLTTKVSDSTYSKLKHLLDQNPQNDMSRLVRAILNNQPVRVFTRDITLDNLMEELTRLRTEIKHIGVNINQITRKFNTYPEPQRKAFYAKMAFQEYLAIEPRINRLIDIITPLSQKWLQE
ncbi:MAG TPA: plasmid mobilization relaxosome protein MobC [Puia sp.]|uniref:plasmid mobilization protein n=1 Tax=Puia sp. TaxID=2045100 RepID=UPI002BD60355|nr:plasmid mobilization relaxosome protein MobC [Puia sp.]HVU96875.1 plasmid mobilization relaxosome protein MobC [Puia sp.]